MKINKEDVDIEKIIQLDKEKDKICDQRDECQKQIEEYNRQYDQINKQMINLLLKGYWWSCDIDKNWDLPKKYSIKDARMGYNGLCITVKEVVKKKPWASFTGETLFNFDEFSKINIYKTEEDAKTLYPKRICPKCGGTMGFVKTGWCKKCMDQRYKDIEEFERSHTFYCALNGNIYKVGYEDEFNESEFKGFDGKHFILRRLDTGEIIETSNLWSCGFGDNTRNLPEIEFVYDNTNSFG